MNYYVATKLERYSEHNKVRDLMAAAGHVMTYDWSTHGPVYKQGKHRLEDVAALETKGVTSADLVIGLLPGGRGTHTEIGIAIGSGIPVLLHASKADAVNLFAAAAETCAFYHLKPPQVYLCTAPIEQIPAIAETIRSIDLLLTIGASDPRPLQSLMGLTLPLERLLHGA